MNNKEILSTFNIRPSAIRKHGSVFIVTANDKKKYVLKKKKRKTNSFDYLKTRNFNNFPNVYTNVDDDIELMDYLIDKNTPKEQRLEDIVYIDSILHNKTTFYKNVDDDYIKELYETTIDKINIINSFYNDLQNIIEQEVYMSPANYLLIRNISIIYISLRRSREYLDKWYQIIQKDKKIRYAYIHGNLEENHLIESDNLYLISWDNSRIDLPIYDIIKLYQNSFMDISIQDILEIYELKYPLKKEEYYLLISLLLIPEKINLNNSEYPKCKEINNLIFYIDKTLTYLEKNPEKTNYNQNH